MAFAFFDTLKLKRQLADGLVGCMKPPFETGHILLQLTQIALQKERLPDKFKQLLEHDG